MSLTSGRMELYILVLLASVSYLNKHERGALTRSIKSLPVPIAGCCYGNANFKPQSPPVILNPLKFLLFINEQFSSIIAQFLALKISGFILLLFFKLSYLLPGYGPRTTIV